MNVATFLGYFDNISASDRPLNKRCTCPGNYKAICNVSPITEMAPVDKTITRPLHVHVVKWKICKKITTGTCILITPGNDTIDKLVYSGLQISYPSIGQCSQVVDNVYLTITI